MRYPVGASSENAENLHRVYLPGVPTPRKMGVLVEKTSMPILFIRDRRAHPVHYRGFTTSEFTKPTHKLAFYFL